LQLRRCAWNQRRASILPASGYIFVVLANRDPQMATNIVDFITSVTPSDLPRGR
jgi:hypothetical protein